MADDTAATTTGIQFRTDKDGAVHTFVTKIQLGKNDEFDGFVSTDIPMPVHMVADGVESDKFGYVGDIDAADSNIDVWVAAGGATSEYTGTRITSKTFPAAASTLYMASDNAGDTAEVTVEYLDASGVAQTVSANLTGQTAVNLGVTALDSNRAYLSGDDESNTGNIYISHDADHTGGVPNDLTQILAVISGGQGQTEQMLYTVPAAKNMRINAIELTGSRLNGAAGSMIIELQVKTSGGSWLVKRHWNIQTGIMPAFGAGLVFGPLAQLRLRVVSVSDNNTAVSGEIRFDLLDV